MAGHPPGAPTSPSTAEPNFVFETAEHSTGDAGFAAPASAFNYDLDQFYNKWERDLIDSQNVNEGSTYTGWFSNVAPLWQAKQQGGYGGGWGDAGVVIPFTAWQEYGDTVIVQNSYTAMQKWITALQTASTGLILPDGFSPPGDWMNVNQGTSPSLLATAYFAYDTSLLAQMADAVGKTSDAANYRDLFNRISTAWQAKFVEADGTIVGNTQTDYVVALKVGLIPDSQRAVDATRLVDLIKAQNNHLQTGFIGTQWVLQALTDSGHADVAYTLIKKTDFPSWGYEIGFGATTMWERWDAIQSNGNFNPDLVADGFNLPVGADVGSWMCSTILGIVADPANPGYKHFSIHPLPGGSLTSASGSLQSPYGKIAIDWSKTDTKTTLSVQVSQNTTATVYVPSTSGVVAPAGVTQVGTDAQGYPGYSVPPGSYTFTAR